MAAVRPAFTSSELRRTRLPSRSPPSPRGFGAASFSLREKDGGGSSQLRTCLSILGLICLLIWVHWAFKRGGEPILFDILVTCVERAIWRGGNLQA
jgi:hypothetical protein